MELLIKNVMVLDHHQTFEGDVYIKDGYINEVGKSLDKNCEIFEGKGLTLMPGFIDLHAHFRDPGFTYKEDIESGSKAAIKGGYTTVVLMANTNPPVSSRETYNYVLEKSKEINLIDIKQCITVTKDLKGETTEHLDKIFEYEDIRVISEDGKGVMNSKLLIEAMNKAKDKGIVVISHAESHDLSKIDMRLAENTMTWRDITLAKYTGAKLHMAHVSTKEAMKYIIDAKNEGANVTCEVTPHHIALNSNISYRVNPPIREEEDRLFLIEAIRKGYVDAIGTDHAPHSQEDKKNGAPGLIGLESAFTVCNTKLTREGHISLNKLSEIMSYGPAKILGESKGAIEIGYIADLVLVDEKAKVRIEEETINSKSKNTPFIGFEGYGKVVATIKNGRVVYREEI